MSTSQNFDLESFTRAIEERDAGAQLAVYAPDTEVTLIDRSSPPSTPRVLCGVEEVRAWIEDVCGRDMTHRVQHVVCDSTGAAFTEACRYPDGTAVACATVLELSEGRVRRQTVVQAWDE